MEQSDDEEDELCLSPDRLPVVRSEDNYTDLGSGLECCYDNIPNGIDVRVWCV